MARKERSVRRIDERNDNIVTGGADLLQIGSSAVTSPGIVQPPGPTFVTVGTQVLLRTTYTPKVAVNVSYGAPANLLPEFYQIQYAEDSGFTVNVLNVTSSQTTAALEMKTNTDYWIRVRAMIRGLYSEWEYPSNYPTVSVHTIDDTTPPAAVSGVTTNWTTGDLIISWTNPSSSNFFQTRLRIYNAAGSILYKEVMIVGNPGSTSQYRFTVDENRQVTGGTFLTSVKYELLAYSLAGVPAVTTISGTVTKPAVTKPATLTHTWSGDDGTYDETVVVSWSGVSGAADYVLTIDGNQKITPLLQYTYTFSENVSDHRPTLQSGDPVLAMTIQARDPLGQISPGLSGTATNVAPQSSNLALTMVAGFSSLYAYVTPTTEIKDLNYYNWTLRSGGVTVKSAISNTPEISFTTLNGTYELQVYAVDMFGQKSATLSGTSSLDGLTIAQLRAETEYTNSLGTNPSSLTGLKDGNLVQSVITIPSGTTWRWHMAERPLLDRYRSITVALSGALTNMPRLYFGTSSDNNTFRWWSGPLTSTGSIAGNTTLTEYGTEANAQTNAVLATNINRFDLPSIIEARFVRMGHRGNIHNLTEFYPRRLVQSDDIEAESIKAINIAAGNILADHIFVLNLGAITANIGQLVIDPTGYIWQGTGTPDVPYTGLKIYSTGGLGRLTTYSGGVEQIRLDTDGKLKAAGGAVILDSTGIDFDFTAAGVNTGYVYLDWKATTTMIAELGVDNLVGFNIMNLGTYNTAGTLVRSQLQLVTDKTTPSLSYAAFNIDGYNSTSISKVGIFTDALRLGTSATAPPAGGIDAVFTGGSKTGWHLSVHNASADVLLKLDDNAENIIGTGSYFIKGIKGSTDMFSVRGDGLVTAAGDVFIIQSGGDPRMIVGDSTAGGDFGYVQWNSAGDELRIGLSTGGDAITITEGENIGINGASFGSGTGVIFILNRTAAPSSNPTGGGILYTESGALKYRGSSGTVTTIANA